jgi:hypothetical protein
MRETSERESKETPHFSCLRMKEIDATEAFGLIIYIEVQVEATKIFTVSVPLNYI